MPFNSNYDKCSDFCVSGTMYKELNNVKVQENMYFGW